MSTLLPPFHNPRWADGAVVYQIYPRSFQDSNDDGVGDLIGATQRFSYLKSLGVTAIWLSPFYPSPMADFGYDVADYCDVDPLFGTLADFKKMLRLAHKHNLKVMIDIVPSHTSDEHKWFKASAASREGAYADWYIWRDPIRYDGDTPVPPNNWLDMFSGDSAWKWVPERQQFYLHSFHEKQPDLNWENPEVHEAIKNVFRFWLDLGVDGFRVDAVPFMAKDPALTDNPNNPDYNPEHGAAAHRYLRTNSQGWPRHFHYLGELSQVLTERPYLRHPRFMVTEGYVARENAVDNYMAYYRAMDPSVAAPFIFEGVEQALGAETWQSFLTKLHDALEAHDPRALPTYAFGNHDQSRLVTRYGIDRARAIAVLQLTLPGMTFIYNGEEIGMRDVPIPPELVKDPSAAGSFGRDPVRTPMQWSSDPGAGFTTATPWLPFASDYETQNVEVQTKDPRSFLNLYRALIRLRTRSKAFSRSNFDLINTESSQVLAYTCFSRRKRYIVIVNFADTQSTFHLDHAGFMLISSIDGSIWKKVEKGPLTLRAHEAVVIECLRV